LKDSLNRKNLGERRETLKELQGGENRKLVLEKVTFLEGRIQRIHRILSGFKAFPLKGPGREALETGSSKGFEKPTNPGGETWVLSSKLGDLSKRSGKRKKKTYGGEKVEGKIIRLKPGPRPGKGGYGVCRKKGKARGKRKGRKTLPSTPSLLKATYEKKELRKPLKKKC